MSARRAVRELGRANSSAPAYQSGQRREPRSSLLYAATILVVFGLPSSSAHATPVKTRTLDSVTEKQCVAAAQSKSRKPQVVTEARYERGGYFTNPRCYLKYHRWTKRCGPSGEPRLKTFSGINFTRRACRRIRSGFAEGGYRVRQHSYDTGPMRVSSCTITVSDPDCQVGTGARLGESRSTANANLSWRRLRRRPCARPKGRLVVRTKPKGAKVVIDKVLEGTTPFSEWLKPGKRRLSLRLEGYEPWKQVVRLRKRRTLRLSVDLQAKEKARQEAKSRSAKPPAVAPSPMKPGIRNTMSFIERMVGEYGSGSKSGLRGLKFVERWYRGRRRKWVRWSNEFAISFSSSFRGDADKCTASYKLMIDFKQPTGNGLWVITYWIKLWEIGTVFTMDVSYHQGNNRRIFHKAVLANAVAAFDCSSERSDVRGRYYGCNNPPRSKYVSLWFTSENVAKRIVKAFKHLARNCKQKRGNVSPF